MRPVTDPAILAQLNGETAPQASAGARPVTDERLLRELNAPDFGIDWSRPIPEVRAEVGKLAPEERAEALRQWARAYVRRERSDPNRHNEDFVRNVSRGTIVGPLLDELEAGTRGAVHTITGGRFGAPYDESVAYERATNEAIDEESPVISTATQVAGGIASARPLITMPASLPGRIATGSAVGTGHAAAAGYGNAEGDWDSPERIQGALNMAPMGTVLGGFLPAGVALAGAGGRAINDAISPSLARYGAQARTAAENLRHRMGVHASADGGTPPSPREAGADAAADQMLANTLMRANKTTDDVEDVLAKRSNALDMGHPSRGIDVEALVDVSPEWQGLVGTMARQQPEVANMGQRFFDVRQRGVTPDNPLHAGAGLPHRREGTAPITGAQARKLHGTDYGMGDKVNVPMSQQERLTDMAKRALRIKDAKRHGHQRNTYQTEKALVAQQKATGQKLYGQTYKAGEGVDIAPALDPTFQKWATNSVEMSGMERAAVQRGLRLFTNQKGEIVKSIRHFQGAKEVFDGMIDDMARKNPRIARTLREVQNDLLASVDGIKQNGLGARYQVARREYASDARTREMIDLGRSLAKEDSDAVPDMLEGLSKGDLKLVRLGYLGALDKRVNRDKRFDATKVFGDPNHQEILRALIPRSQGSKDVMNDRAARFLEFVQGERAKVNAGQEIFGNSKTAQRLADDQANTAMMDVLEQMRSSSLSNLGLRGVTYILDKLFGMRADTAATIGRKMFSADERVRRITIEAVKRRMGPKRFDMFTLYVNALQRDIASSVERTAVGQSMQGQQQ